MKVKTLIEILKIHTPNGEVYVSSNTGNNKGAKVLTAVGHHDVGHEENDYTYLLTKQPEPHYRLSGWITKDEDGEVKFWSVKPERCEANDKGNSVGYGYWWLPGAACITMELGYTREFADLKYEDEPLRVGLCMDPLEEKTDE